jgi:CheY-like chemotaxis protein
LNSVVANMEKMLQRLIGEDVVLKSAPAAGLWHVKADQSQIEQVIMNLAVNARDAMPQGGQLTIETANIELDQAYATTHFAVTPGKHVLMAVSDTGVGMDAETQKRIFEPFFTTKEAGKGTGLGLSTVYGIVKQSGGNIWVYSVPGQGTTFKVYFPRVEPEAVESAEATPKAEARILHAETILLVEDEDALRALARRVLESRGYEVLEAGSGAQALEIFEKRGSDIKLLLTDVIMPKMGGRELAQKIVAQQPKIKVLFMSGYTDDAIVRHGMLESGTAFVQKPFAPEALAFKVREVLDRPSN